jgi:hypothetical protein
MPYAPTVNDESGQILAGYKTKSAEITAAGNEALTKGIVSGVTSAVGGITGGIMQNYTKAQETALVKEGNMGTGAALSEVFKTYGTPEQFQNFMTGWEENAGNANREAGYLSGQQAVGSALMSMARENARIDGYKDLADYKSSLGPGTDTTSSPRLNADYFRGMVAEAKAAGFTDDAIKSKLQQQFGDYAVRFIYPPQDQGIWPGR